MLDNFVDVDKVIDVAGSLEDGELIELAGTANARDSETDEDLTPESTAPTNQEALKAISVLKRWAAARERIHEERLISEVEEFVNRATLTRCVQTTLDRFLNN